MAYPKRQEPTMNSARKTSKAKKPTEALFAKIALDHCFVETLETRNADSLDFHSISVWGLESALQAAYEAGMQAGRANAA
jgi:hypothetical protein